MTRRMLAWLGFTLLGIALVQPAAAQKKAPEAALAQAEVSGGVVRLGVLTDETGVLSSASGEGSIEASWRPGCWRILWCSTETLRLRPERKS